MSSSAAISLDNFYCPRWQRDGSAVVHLSGQVVPAGMQVTVWTQRGQHSGLQLDTVEKEQYWITGTIHACVGAECVVLTRTNSRRNSLMRSVFRSNGTLYTCFIRMAFLWRIWSNVERLTVWMFLNVAWSARILVFICLSVIACSHEPYLQFQSPVRLWKCVFFLHGVVLFQSCKNINTVSTLYSIDMQYYSTQGK